MMDALDGNGLTFDGPAVYRIRVRGRLSARWSDRLEGMLITVDSSENGPPLTTLIGQLADQASLAGILRTLYELHLPVVSVQCLSGTIS